MSVKRFDWGIKEHRDSRGHYVGHTDVIEETAGGRYVLHSDHAAAVARLREAGDRLENELNDLRAAAVLHGGILLRNRIDNALAAWRKAKESA